LEECGPCPVFMGFTLAFALQMRKKHGKTSVRVAEECQLGMTKIHKYTLRIHRHNNKNLCVLFQVCWIRDIWTDLKMSTSIWSPTVKVQTDIKHTSQVTTRTWTTRNTSDDFKIVFMRSLYSHSSIHWYSFISNAKLLLDSKSHYRYYTPKTYRLYFLVHLSISCTRG